MSSYTITGAGISGYNGVYTDTGMVANGLPIYQLDSTHVMFSDATGGNHYYLAPATTGYTGSGTFYEVIGDHPDIGTWTTGPHGIAPAPTVTTAGSCTNRSCYTYNQFDYYQFYNREYQYSSIDIWCNKFYNANIYRFWICNTNKW